MPASIYLDHNATTPVATEVVEAMATALRNSFGNPSSSYALGREAAEQIATARDAVASLIGAPAQSLVFTGCATEANNLALLGVARACPPGKRHLVISAVEHPAVMAPARYLEAQGWRLTLVPVDETGQVSAEAVIDAVRPDTALVSIMLANNEVGTLQPVADIARHLANRDVLLHTDAAQAVGKIALDVEALGIDLLTIAGHKFQASKGVGALYVREGTPIRSVLFGAGHEKGLRPGTENVPAIIGLGVAANLAAQRLASNDTRLRDRRDQLHQRLGADIPDLRLNGHAEARLPNTLNVSFPSVSGQALLDVVRDTVMASVGSACHSGESTPSGVLGAMGLDTARALGAVRLSVGWDTTAKEIEAAAVALVQAWRHLADGR
ncbi:cysteine desulfurase family protein [Halomonas rhizosphaerae]|uniref:cysteine desulfurase n=1 Tax=Halomonas rhizosphaerae TaxID=3043296 RepID=A0ABT6V0P1_9GAMM|nr:cysteine desulfurase family protein [Halomonas rhizosphaerae]MDI5891793.1 cysteine desulfurase family protein [Halomonas rhizosphaerae]